MGTHEEIRVLQERRHQSARAVGINTALLLLIAVFLWVLNHFIHLPRWLILIGLGLTASSVLCEAWMYLRHGRRLKALQNRAPE